MVLVSVVLNYAVLDSAVLDSVVLVSEVHLVSCGLKYGKYEFSVGVK